MVWRAASFIPPHEMSRPLLASRPVDRIHKANLGLTQHLFGFYQGKSFLMVGEEEYTYEFDTRVEANYTLVKAPNMCPLATYTPLHFDHVCDLFLVVKIWGFASPLPIAIGLPRLDPPPHPHEFMCNYFNIIICVDENRIQ